MAKPGQNLASSKGLGKNILSKTKTPEKTETHKERGKPEKKATQKIDVVKTIVDLYHEGFTPSKIGLILRDKYKIFNVKKYTGKTISQILKEKGLEPEIPEDLSALLKKAVRLLKHMKVNKKDQTAKLGYTKTVSKIRALAKYYRRAGKLPKDWSYNAEQAVILVK